MKIYIHIIMFLEIDNFSIQFKNVVLRVFNHYNLPIYSTLHISINNAEVYAQKIPRRAKGNVKM